MSIAMPGNTFLIITNTFWRSVATVRLHFGESSKVYSSILDDIYWSYNSLITKNSKIFHQNNSYACDDYVINETQSKRILGALEQFQNNQASPKPNKRKDQPQNDTSLSPVSIRTAMI